MKIAPVADVKARFSAFVEECQSGPVIVTKNGRPVAVLVGALDADDLDSLVLAYSPRFRALLDAADQRVRADGGIPHDEFWAQVDEEVIKTG